ncbi:hypothetical protein [Nostoc sp.]
MINAIRQWLRTRSHLLAVCQLENVKPTAADGFSCYSKIDWKKP